MPSRGGMATSTPAALRKGLLAASQQHFRGKATLQLSHSYNHSIRAVIFITVITPMSSFYKSHFLQKTLLKFLSGLVFSLELSGEGGGGEIKYHVCCPSSQSCREEKGCPQKHHLCQE